MPIAILSDVHANLEALEVVLADIRRRECDRIVCLGDFVGYGPNPNECVDLLSPLLGGRNVAGNHDWAAVGKLDITFFNPYAQEAILWTQQALRLAVQQYLTALPTEWSQDGPLPFLAVHASPRNPIEEYVLDAYTAGANFLLRPFALCFIGHTHMPAVWVQTRETVEARAFLADEETPPRSGVPLPDQRGERGAAAGRRSAGVLRRAGQRGRGGAARPPGVPAGAHPGEDAA